MALFNARDIIVLQGNILNARNNKYTKDEPDFAFINKHPYYFWIARNALFGTLCGYVASPTPLLPSFRELFHYGVTYQSHSTLNSLVEKNNFLFPDIPLDLNFYIYGFDCAHNGDIMPFMSEGNNKLLISHSSTYKDFKYVLSNLEKIWLFINMYEAMSKAYPPLLIVHPNTDSYSYEEGDILEPDDPIFGLLSYTVIESMTLGPGHDKIQELHGQLQYSAYIFEISPMGEVAWQLDCSTYHVTSPMRVSKKLLPLR